MLVHETKPRRVDTAPSAYVTKEKQRIKQYNNDTVFLNNGEEFEIELYNPTSSKFLAKIELNGKSIGSGVVLRPGERVFLERYLDVAKKFLFETYNVEGDSEVIKQAIKDNGNLRVLFYKEVIPVEYTPTITWTTTRTAPVWPPREYTYFDINNTKSKTRSASLGHQAPSAGGASASDTTMYMTNMGSERSFDCIDYAPQEMSRSFVGQTLEEPKTRKMSKSIRPESLETGRIERGSHSNQNLILDSSSFEYYYSYETTWKILPMSQKILVKEDLSVFCTECGAKRKKDSFKFCPNCGAKF